MWFVIMIKLSHIAELAHSNVAASMNRLCCCWNVEYECPCRDNEVYFRQIFCYFDNTFHSLSYSSVYLPFAVSISPLCDLPEYRWCWGAEHPLGLQQSQTEGRGGGKRSENDKHEHGGSWGQLKIAQRRGGESDGESAGATMRETQAGLFLDVLRMKCFAVGTGGKKKKNVYSWVHVPFSQMKQELF